ncbi:uncharacterized protein LOC106087982 [Stomoxys calcitrans]|uniref:uncharacterized protein LOC106087982 n=1 Tax=Stomoxys calcitrans TaxID=35570 RepID=UPI0027E3098D|nr:uncharacterized protein LOC106087982 [Stomoxys calcitrans]
MNIVFRCISIAVLGVLLQITTVYSACQECMSTNDAYCVDEESYYLCLNGNTPSTSKLYKCETGHVCTADEKICLPRKGAANVENEPVCGGGCNICPTTGRYTCVSRTEFGRCVNNEITMTSSCEEGFICSVELLSKTNAICAPKCVADFYGAAATCHNDEVITTTTTQIPVDPTTYQSQCLLALSQQTSNIYYIRNNADPECRSYLYCEKFNNGEVEALLMRCKTGYFNSVLLKCQADFPAECAAPIDPQTLNDMEG